MPAVHCMSRPMPEVQFMYFTQIYTPGLAHLSYVNR
jgi:hypothetical protein